MTVKKIFGADMMENDIYPLEQVLDALDNSIEDFQDFFKMVEEGKDVDIAVDKDGVYIEGTLSYNESEDSYDLDYEFTLTGDHDDAEFDKYTYKRKHGCWS